MNDHIKRFDPDQEYYFEEGCHIVEVSNSSQDSDVSIARARVTPRQRTKWHQLQGTSERYVILEGIGSVEVGDAPACEVAAGDVVIIPPDTRQRITNIGESDLLFLAICSPRFQKRNYQETPSQEAS